MAQKAFFFPPFQSKDISGFLSSSQTTFTIATSEEVKSSD